MAFDVLSFVMGQKAAKGSGGGSSRTTVLSKADYSFSYSTNFGAYSNSVLSLLFNLEKDKEYIVEWDETEYKRTAFEFTSADGSSCIALGNPIAAGQESNGDSFAIVVDRTHEYTHFLSLEQTETHSIAIYQEASGGSGGGSSGDGWTLTKHFFGSATMNGGTSDERISVNIGFKPDLLIVLKNDTATTSNHFLYMGYSQRLANAVGMSISLSARNTSSKYFLSKSGCFIDDETSNSVIHKADETGFNLGSSWPYSGSYLVFAFGME